MSDKRGSISDYASREKEFGEERGIRAEPVAMELQQQGTSPRPGGARGVPTFLAESCE
jgi:hypothetical protein